MLYIYRSSEIKKADQQAEQRGMSVFTLMELAGSGLFRAIEQEYNIHMHTFTIIAGKGNNGGDGIVLARYLQRSGAQCTLVFPAGLPESSAAREHLAYYCSLGFTWSEELPERSGSVLIDSLLGAGIKLPLTAGIRRLTDWMNCQQAQKLAVDLPTGSASNSGECDKHAFRADETYCLHGWKPSRFLHPAAALYGKSHVIDIGLPHTANWKVISAADIRSLFFSAKTNAHKGTFGHGLLIAGGALMPGSAALAAEGAVSCGAGKLTVQTDKQAISVIASRVPEAIYSAKTGIEPNHVYDAVAAGCGRQADEQMEQIVTSLLHQEKPVLLDAGALRQRSYRHALCPVVVTPHPGEFARMTGRPISAIQQNRIKEASSYAIEHKVTVVLKGEYTVVAFADGGGFINPTGNEGLSKGGSGDVLTGMMLALIMRSGNVQQAAAAAVYLHGFCADQWTKQYPAQTMTPTQIFKMLPAALQLFLKEKK